MKNIEVIETGRYDEEAYESVSYIITADGEEVGTCEVMADESSWSYIERIDIHEQHRNNGYGTAAINKLSDIYGGIVLAPDNADARRLYERIGCEFSDDTTDYIDQGYGVYRV